MTFAKGLCEPPKVKCCEVADSYAPSWKSPCRQTETNTVPLNHIYLGRRKLATAKALPACLVVAMLPDNQKPTAATIG